MLFYRAALPLSSWTLTYLSGIIHRHRSAAGSRWRKLNPGKQALLVLVYLRKGETFAELAAGFGVGTTTAWRYVNETVALLAVRAPKLGKAVRMGLMCRMGRLLHFATAPWSFGADCAAGRSTRSTCRVSNNCMT
jgi:hypothetical protein